MLKPLGSFLDWVNRALLAKGILAALFLGAALAALAWLEDLSWTGRILAVLFGTALVLLIVVCAQVAIEKWRAGRQAIKGKGGPGVVAVQGLTDVAFAGWDRALAQAERVGHAAQAKAELETSLATERANGAALSASITGLLASNEELTQLVRSNLTLADLIEDHRQQAEQRFDAAMTTLRNMSAALSQGNTDEDRESRALSFARQFWEAVEFFIKTPPSPRPPGFSPGLPTEAMSRFRAIVLSPPAAVVKVTAVTPMLGSGPDSGAGHDIAR